MVSEIIICKGIKLDKNHINVLNYNEENMVSLCRQKKIASADDYSFIRNRGTINTGFTYSQALQCNYMAFQNKDYSNKWFFAFIDNVTYISDNCTEISYTIDSFSTWWDYWTKKKCFVNRQHVLDDTIGINTVPENLDIGEVMEEFETVDDSYTNTYGYYLAITSNYTIEDNSTGNEVLPTNRGSQFSGISVYDNTVFGTKIFLFSINSANDFVNAGLFLLRTNYDGHIEDVKDMFILPNIAINQADLVLHSAYAVSNDFPFQFYTIPYDMNIETFDTTITKRHSFSDYTPHNNKLFCYPYNYLFVSNNQGSHNIYKYEDFYSTNCVFENQFSLAIGGSGRIVPKSYKNMIKNEDESIALGKYPTCAWSADSFTNWLTQNAVNMVATPAIIAGGIATSFATAGATAPIVAGATLSVSGNIAKSIGDFRNSTLLPNIEGGQSTGDIIWASNTNCFTFREMRAKTEYLKIIDSFFDRFGYKISKIDTVNLSGRRNWNYVEIGSNETIGNGDVPSSYMEIINNAFRRGVTIWHTHDNIGDYSLNNDIL